MSERPALGEIKAGDEVFVRLATYGRKRDWREKPVPALVVKASRVWLDLQEQSAGERYPRTWRMRRDTQDDGNCQFPQNADRFVTRDQLAFDEAFEDASAFLRSQGIDVRQGSPWYSAARMIELAEILRAAVQR